jgi:hypothetical protein
MQYFLIIIIRKDVIFFRELPRALHTARLQLPVFRPVCWPILIFEGCSLTTVAWRLWPGYGFILRRSHDVLLVHFVCTHYFVFVELRFPAISDINHQP